MDVQSSDSGRPASPEAGGGRAVEVGPLRLAGTLAIPLGARSAIVFVHGSGSSRHSPRNIAVARALNARGFATLLFDLLRGDEDAERHKVFDIPLLAERLLRAIAWMKTQEPRLALGLFGASTGAAAALVVAAAPADDIGAVVSRGGRPDLAGPVLGDVHAPTLLIVGGADEVVLDLNRWAFDRLRGTKALEVVPGASHLFPEPGAMEQVIAHAAGWFERFLPAPGRGGAIPGGSEDIHAVS